MSYIAVIGAGFSKAIIILSMHNLGHRTSKTNSGILIVLGFYVLLKQVKFRTA
jgi:hypothetical protein